MRKKKVENVLPESLPQIYTVFEQERILRNVFEQMKNEGFEVKIVHDAILMELGSKELDRYIELVKEWSEKSGEPSPRQNYFRRKYQEITLWVKRRTHA